MENSTNPLRSCKATCCRQVRFPGPVHWCHSGCGMSCHVACKWRSRDASTPKATCLCDHDTCVPVQVVVHNNIPADWPLVSEGISIHWHGFSMTSGPWYDGVGYLAQCPIRAGTNFTYRFQVSNFPAHIPEPTRASDTSCVELLPSLSNPCYYVEDL